MRILHILDHSIPHASGYSYRTLSILKQQRAMGWETFHVTSPKQGLSAAEEETVDGWHFFRTQPPGGLCDGVPLLGEAELMGETAHRIEQAVKRVRPHILHAHSPVLNAIPALRVGRRHRIPVVYEVRAFWEDAAVDHGTAKDGGLRYRLTRALETWSLKRADAVTTICEGLRDDMVVRGIPAGKITVIPNAVDTEQFATGRTPDPALRAQLGLEGALVLGFVGSFYAYEGLAVLLRAMPALVSQYPSVRALLVGGGRQERELRQLAAELGIARYVTFAGSVPHGEVGRYYDLIDVLVYPRLSMRLTELVTPLKPLEAMAQGKLVSASDIGGHRELIHDGETGVLFRPGDPAHLAARVLDLIRHPALAPRLKTNARAYVERERTWRASVARYRPIYEAVAEGAAS